MEKAPGILVKEDEEQRQKTNEIVTPPLSRKRKLSGEEGEKKASMELPSLTEEPNIPFPIELQEGASTQIYSSGNLCEGCLGGGALGGGVPSKGPPHAKSTPSRSGDESTGGSNLANEIEGEVRTDKCALNIDKTRLLPSSVPVGKFSLVQPN